MMSKQFVMSVVVFGLLVYGVIKFVGLGGEEPVATASPLNTTPIELREQQSSNPSLNDKDVNGLSEQLSKLTSALTDIDQRLSALEANSSIVTPTIESDGLAEIRRQRNQDPEVAHQQFVNSLQESFAVEPVSAAWSEESSSSIQTMFLQPEVPIFQTSQLVGLECRSSSCRVEVAHDESVATDDFESEFLIEASKAGFNRVRGHLVEAEDGTQGGVYYFSASTAPE